MHDEIESKHQEICRLERSLLVEKIKKRKADTRNKIQLGGLIIKSRMSEYNKDVILGALIHSFQSIGQDRGKVEVFAKKGRRSFVEGEKQRGQ